MSQPDSLTERYGAPSVVVRRTLVAVVTVVAAAFLGWLAWVALAEGDPDVTSELVTWEVRDEHTVTTRVDVRLRADDVVASCLLRAYAEDHTVVGELAFEVTEADVADGTELTREIRTERRATSVESVGCTTPDQPRPR
ncbi:MAG: DUF4307 domain-containing protein [Nocardioides sp.]